MHINTHTHTHTRKSRGKSFTQRPWAFHTRANVGYVIKSNIVGANPLAHPLAKVQCRPPSFAKRRRLHDDDDVCVAVFVCLYDEEFHSTVVSRLFRLFSVRSTFCSQTCFEKKGKAARLAPAPLRCNYCLVLNFSSPSLVVCHVFVILEGRRWCFAVAGNGNLRVGDRARSPSNGLPPLAKAHVSRRKCA